jgi:hypothetical protein
MLTVYVSAASCLPNAYQFISEHRVQSMNTQRRLYDAESVQAIQDYFYSTFQRLVVSSLAWLRFYPVDIYRTTMSVPFSYVAQPAKSAWTSNQAISTSTRTPTWVRDPTNLNSNR